MDSEKPILKVIGYAQPPVEPSPKPEPTEGYQRYRGVNLYVSNLDARVDDDYLWDLFSPFGEIISSKVMYDPFKQSPKGFGFVCFSSAEDATRAIEYMNGNVVFSQPLHVSVAIQKKGYKKNYTEHQQRMHGHSSDEQESAHSQHKQSPDKVPVSSKRKNEEHHGGDPHEKAMDATALSSRISSLLNQKAFSDVQFSVGTDVFYAHKLFLALSSKVFASMFYGEYALGELKPIVVSSDITSRGFFNMLQYVYTEHLEFDSVQDAKETLKAAEKYCLSDLQTECRDHLFGSCEISADNVCFIFENADISNISDVVDKCQKIFQTETKDVLKSSHFLSSNLATVEAILKNKYLNIDSELDLIEAVVAWGKEECRRHNVCPDAANVRTCVGPLLKYLRFLSLPTDVFFKMVKETELLSTPEACMITLKLSQPELSTDLPPGICENTKRRVPLPASKLSFCFFKFPLIETEQMLSTGFKGDIVSSMHITVEKGQVKIYGVILEIKKLRFQVDVLDVSFDVKSNSEEYNFQEKIQASGEPVTVMFKTALHIPRKQSVLLTITVEDLQVNRCYSCKKADFTIEKTDIKLKVHLSGNEMIENSFLFPVSLLLYEKCRP